MSMPHICTVQHETSRTYLPYDEDTKNIFHKFSRCFRDWCMVWKKHPKFCYYYRSTTAYLEERKSHATSRYFYIIHPMSKLCFSLEMILIALYLFAFIYYPLAASFYDLKNYYTRKRHLMEEAFQIFFIIEILVRLFVGRKNPRLRKVTISHPKILRSYIVSIYFIGDMCGALPVSFCISLTEDPVILASMAAIRLGKILRLMSLLDYFCKLLEILRMSAYKRVCSFIIVSFIAFHWFACVYHGIKRFRTYLVGESRPEDSPVYKYQSANSSGAVYIQTAFRTMGIILSTRRESAMKRGIEHKMFSFLLLVFGRVIILVLGVLLINQILRAAKLDTEYREVIGQLKEFMNRKKLPIATRNRLLSFYEYKFQGKFVKEKKIENMLSDRIKKEINYHASNKLIQQVQIFEDIPTKILTEIISHLKSEVFLPNDIIISAGTTADSMYFISSGTVSVTTASGREVCHLQDGGYFGEAALVLNHKKSISSVTALEICETYRLDSKTFRNCFKNYPEIFHKLRAEAERREQETNKLEEEFQEKLFLRTYFGDKRRSTFESGISGDDLGVIPSKKNF
ncbi:potassium/sodium hyperpolarization-activated cyclic nucleotide-gated channel 1-like [Coccinella septempunctata]|uniref:potassium/sodium hyperpolarization-activated cyclic nucleotide-gated channel 1-like n=1 Tax=Coccinella septempunctata TaxID=41139 RepID=UPI001D086D63|nr:potassium/sodium hyperpolarization-activated cyclic nucleotide-gated channel 1-like [Coccinella septempunctata]